mmetsp:Transcript_34074/g.75540  ORF Transcript_34074/g.75540 Transcript_34074/m.75540 type:complete len:118 (-) Transcript_34074:934-1287(-)
MFGSDKGASWEPDRPDTEGMRKRGELESLDPGHNPDAGPAAEPSGPMRPRTARRYSMPAGEKGSGPARPADPERYRSDRAISPASSSSGLPGASSRVRALSKQEYGSSPWLLLLLLL